MACCTVKENKKCWIYISGGIRKKHCFFPAGQRSPEFSLARQARHPVLVRSSARIGRLQPALVWIDVEGPSLAGRLLSAETSALQWSISLYGRSSFYVVTTTNELSYIHGCFATWRRNQNYALSFNIDNCKYLRNNRKLSDLSTDVNEFFGQK